MNANNWDSVRHTRFCNAVYDAVKSVRPKARLGGPYSELTLTDRGDLEGKLIVTFTDLEAVRLRGRERNADETERNLNLAF
jgi:hypothetical protein